jgi:beta-lactam-binding protein with PASTA domain
MYGTGTAILRPGLAPTPGIMQTKLLTFFRWLFFGSLLLVAGFISCLTAMRLAIRGNEVVVPTLAGKTLEEGNRQLVASSLRIKVESRRFDDRIPKDRIVSQIPVPNSQLKREQSVRVILSLGEKKLPVPKLAGETIRAGQILLLKRGFTLAMLSTIYSPFHEKDMIIAQNPPPEAQLAKSLLMSILVSGGSKPKDFLMPDLLGMDFEPASKKITEAGLKLGDATYQSLPGIAKGTILRQSPAVGSKLSEGGTISMEINR